MFNFLKKDKKKDIKKSKKFGKDIKNILLNKKSIDDNILEQLEMLLISADIGINTIEKIIKNVKDNASRKELKNEDALYKLVQNELLALLTKNNQLTITDAHPFVILVVGVNGAGKTTTIGKLAKQLQNSGKSIMLAAGDTFRAAAIEQLQAWGDRNNIAVISQHTGSDSASVIFDAYQSAKAKNIDVLIADTSGRLHTQDNLMQELAKIKRVLTKAEINAPHETMLVVDGTAGQNAIEQAKSFNKYIDLTGITITKLDGTAKGGVIFAISDEVNLPIRYIGIGEAIDDLQVFDSQIFMQSIFAN